MMILAKGRSASTIASENTRSSNELANSIPTIRVLTDKYGLCTGSEHMVVGETPSGQHWLIIYILLHDKVHFVHKNAAQNFLSLILKLRSKLEPGCDYAHVCVPVLRG